MTARDFQLAIHGGAAAVTGPLPSWPLADDAVRTALDAAYRDGSWGRYHGPHVRRLREQLGVLHQIEQVTLCSSGTIAVELALHGVGVSSGDEVVLAGYDFSGNFRAIEALGARPVLADIAPNNWSLAVECLPAAIGSETRAIVVSHLHGGLAPMGAIVELARSHGVAVVEDACQTPGARIEGRLAGTWGDAGVLSFGGSKLLTAGRGGAVLTQSARIQQRMKIRAQRGNDAYPLSELQAAVLLPQLAKLDVRNRQRAGAVDRLLAGLSHKEIFRPLHNKVPGQPTYYKVPWLVAGPYRKQRAMILAALRAEGAPVDEGFRGFTRRSSRRCRSVGELPHSAAAAEGTILLHHPALLASDALIGQIALAISKVCRAVRADEIASG